MIFSSLPILTLLLLVQGSSTQESSCSVQSSTVLSDGRFVGCFFFSVKKTAARYNLKISQKLFIFCKTVGIMWIINNQKFDCSPGSLIKPVC